MLLLLQTTCDGDMVRAREPTSVGVYRVLRDKGSKVMKGSFPIFRY